MDINQLSSANQATSSKEVANTLYRAKTDQTSKTSSSDSLNLSPEGAILNDLQLGKLDWGRSFTTVPPIPRTAQELNTWFDEYQQAVRESIQKLFENSDLQLQQSVTLQNGNDGSIQVDGQHPQAQEIQQLVNDNPQVATQLQTLGQRSDLFNVLAHGNDLRLAGNENEQSQAAAALSEHLNNPAPYRLTVEPAATGVVASTNQAHSPA
jgi:hypothetical protein